MQLDRRSWTVLVVAIVGALGIAVFFILRESRVSRTTSKAAAELAEAIFVGDAREIFAHVNDAEKEALGLTEEKIECLLAKFVRPRLKGYKPTLGRELSTYNYGGSISIMTPFELPNGRRSNLTLVVSTTDEGPKARELVHCLLNTFQWLDWPDDRPWPKGADGVRFQVESVRKYRSIFESCGINRVFFYAPRQPDMVALTWDEYEAFQRGRLERMAKSEATGG